MTAVDLSAIRALLAGATPGPWKANKDGTIDGENYAEVICRGRVDCMAYCYGGTSVIEGDNLEADAAFIAAAPSIVAQLLAVVYRVEGVAEWIKDNHGDYISREIEDRIRAALEEDQ